MADLIERQAAIEAIRASTKKYTGFMEMEMYTDDDAVEAIINLPPAQPEIIRCKECKHYIQNIHCVGGHYNGCEEWEHDGCEYPVEEDWFCCHAERRQDG